MKFSFQPVVFNFCAQIRRNTGLSFNKSRIAVGTVLGCLKERIPSVGNVMDDVLKNLLQSKVSHFQTFQFLIELTITLDATFYDFGFEQHLVPTNKFVCISVYLL